MFFFVDAVEPYVRRQRITSKRSPKENLPSIFFYLNDYIGSSIEEIMARNELERIRYYFEDCIYTASGRNDSGAQACYSVMWREKQSKISHKESLVVCSCQIRTVSLFSMNLQ